MARWMRGGCQQQQQQQPSSYEQKARVLETCPRSEVQAHPLQHIGRRLIDDALVSFEPSAP